MKGYPRLKNNFQTNQENVYCVGDLAGSALLKLAIRDSEKLISHIENIYEINENSQIGIIGGGIAGIACAYYCSIRNIPYTIYEKTTVLNTIKNFSDDKKIFMEPQFIDVDFPLKFQDCSKAELLQQLESLISEYKLNEHLIMDEIKSFESGSDQKFRLKSDKQTYKSDIVLVTLGVQGDPVLLSKDFRAASSNIYYEANQIEKEFKKDSSKRLLILGGGDTALENAIRFAPKYDTTLVYRGESFYRPQKKNIESITKLRQDNLLTVLLQTELSEVEQTNAKLKDKNGTRSLNPYDAILVNYGTNPPRKWLKNNKIDIDTPWNKSRLLTSLPILFVLMTALIIKFSETLGFSNPIYLEPYWTIAYTLFVDIFGIRVLIKYKTKFIRIRTIMTMASQTILLCIIPLALGDWRLYGLTLAWPLNMWILLHNTSTLSLFYLIYTLVYTFVIIPILTILFGKGFYCSVLCGCGALAETAGDPYRTRSIQGRKAEKFNWVIYVILAWSIVVTILWFLGIWNHYLQFDIYKFTVDIFLGSFVGLGLYSIWGGRIWCRYFCPLAAWMNLWGKLSRYRIEVKEERCIKCEKCNEHCDMGIDVMKFASQGIPISGKNSICVACGWCAEVCPTNVLSYHFSRKRKKQKR